jgi:nitric-oxide synthase
MQSCPFNHDTPVALPVGRETHPVDEFGFLAEAHGGATPPERLAACRAAVADGRPAPLSADELRWAGQIAWRNHARCIGRLHWRSLEVRDRRDLTEPGRIAEALREHLAAVQGDGTVRSLLTVFAPPERAGGPAPRIWNHQLCAYAGYRDRRGGVLGDPRNVELTERALALGWEPPAERGRFDLLPWIIAGPDGRPELFALEPGQVREVRLSHPELPWFEQLALRWYAVPVLTDLLFHAADTDYPAAPFNGWYMGTEIGARNLADAARYDLLPTVADRLGLDRRSERTLWRDRALLTLNEAVLHSYAAAGVKLVDHHTASAEFMRFCEREGKAGREVSARWDWIVPPMSPATTPVFHQPMREFPTTPDFHVQPPAWEGTR